MTQLEAGARIGPYEILRKIGMGGMGAVYEAVHQAIERRVAIKVLHAESARSPEIAKRFLNEARAVNRVGHPSIVQISDLGQLPDGTAYLVMELLVGEPLNVRLRRLGGRLPLAEALDLGTQIAAALAAAHDKGIIHRDLKPENLIVVSDPVAPRGERIKVLDFGIAKLAESTVFPEDGTRSSVILGTPRYMSPEQCRGGGNIDAKADVYSLGVMLYQFLSGKLPFDSKAAGELIVMHITEPPPPLLSLASDLEPALAPALAQVVERLLLKAAPARPTMTEVSQQLQALSRQLAGLSSGSLPVVSPVGATPEVTSMLAPAALPVPSGPQTAPLPLLRESEGAPAGAAVAEHTSDAALRAAGNSTLGQTVGQLRPAPWARRRSLFLVPAALLLVSGVGIGYRSLSSADRRLGSPAVAAADPSPGATTAVGNPPARKRCQLISEPAGASVLRDGKELGKTPLTVDFPSPGSPLLVELRLSGFVTMGLELRPQDGESRLVHLSAENRPPLPRPSSPKKKEKPKGGKSLFDSID